MSLSSLVYELAVNGYVKEPIPKDALVLLRSLSGIANNLNQLAHLARVSHFIEVEAEVREVARRADEVLIKLSEK
ncbi:MAG: plasmid mobilization relaxosome protein MobC [Prevotella sp.]|nr:plasmid mobilization relaxosome protein MobC [Prevotella sp.]